MFGNLVIDLSLAMIIQYAVHFDKSLTISKDRGLNNINRKGFVRAF